MSDFVEIEIDDLDHVQEDVNQLPISSLLPIVEKLVNNIGEYRQEIERYLTAYIKSGDFTMLKHWSMTFGLNYNRDNPELTSSIVNRLLDTNDHLSSVKSKVLNYLQNNHDVALYWMMVFSGFQPNDINSYTRGLTENGICNELHPVDGDGLMYVMFGCSALHLYYNQGGIDSVIKEDCLPDVGCEFFSSKTTVTELLDLCYQQWDQWIEITKEEYHKLENALSSD